MTIVNTWAKSYMIVAFKLSAIKWETMAPVRLYLPTSYPPTSLPAYLANYVPTWLRTYLALYPPTYLSTVSSPANAIRARCSKSGNVRLAVQARGPPNLH